MHALKHQGFEEIRWGDHKIVGSLGTLGILGHFLTSDFTYRPNWHHFEDRDLSQSRISTAT
jgi:hypothetical protein